MKNISLLIAFMLVITTVHATSITLTTANNSWTAPGGIYNNTILVEAWGGGGGGITRLSANGGSGGGGGGAYTASYLYNITAGTRYNISVGIGGVANANGGIGNATYFNWSNTSTVVKAAGGNSTAGSAFPGQLGGLANDGIGQIKYSGGIGGTGNAGLAYGGGGGGAGGNNGTGNNGSDGNPGACQGGQAGTGGGNGGNGACTGATLAGSNGNNIGGGGGGGARAAGAGTTLGGTGGDGQIIISWQDIGNVSIQFLYDQNNTLVNTTNISIQIISSTMSFNSTTNNGTININVLRPENYTIIYGAPGFVTRTYQFTLTNSNFVNLTLRMLSVNLATNISVFVTDHDSKPLEGYTVKLLSYDISTNSYALQQVFTSNIDGQGIMSVILNTQLYEFIVENAGSVVLTTNPSFIYGTTITLVVPTDTFDTDAFFNSQNIVGSITFNNVTNVATFIFDDQDNIATSGCLYTYRTFNTSFVFYNSTCVNASAASMTSSVFLLNGTGWYWTGMVLKGGQNITVATLTINTGGSSPDAETTTFLGVFVMIIIMLLIGLMLVQSDIRLLLIVEGPIPFFFMKIGFIAVDPGFGIVVWIISVIFTVVLSL